MSKVKGKILIVDDDPDILNAARIVLRQLYEFVQTESNPARIPSLLAQQTFDVILLDMNYSTGRSTGNEGLFWLRKILELRAGIEVVMITAYADVNLAVEAMKLGARDFVVKPWENEKLEATVRSAFANSQSAKEIRKLKEKQSHYNRAAGESDTPIVFHSGIMKELMQTLGQIAVTDANVLLLGENGTGKDLVAREIHKRSRRADRPFVKVDVGSLSESLFESELFGHKKGAFTDAKQDRIGRFELADEGTLFLDEIGNLSIAQQTKLLTALENRVIVPVGSNIEVPVDIRLVSATNIDIGSAVKQRIFREDLLYRINTVTLVVPPLRDRSEDIALLADHFIRSFAAKYKKKVDLLSDQVINHLKRHDWPGNVRELRHAIERAVILNDHGKLSVKDFPFQHGKFSIQQSKEINLDEIEKQAIALAMRKHRGNLTLVARELGVGRTTLYRKLERYRINKY